MQESILFYVYCYEVDWSMNDKERTELEDGPLAFQWGVLSLHYRRRDLFRFLNANIVCQQYDLSLSHLPSNTKNHNPFGLRVIQICSLKEIKCHLRPINLLEPLNM